MLNIKKSKFWWDYKTDGKILSKNERQRRARQKTDLLSPLNDPVKKPEYHDYIEEQIQQLQSEKIMSRGFSKSEILEGSLGDLEDPVSISRLFVVDQSSPVKKKLRLITN